MRFVACIAEKEPYGFRVQGSEPALSAFLQLVYYSTDGKEKVENGKTDDSDELRFMRIAPPFLWKGGQGG